jgi:hypothetical protein
MFANTSAKKKSPVIHKTRQTDFFSDYIFLTHWHTLLNRNLFVPWKHVIADILAQKVPSGLARVFETGPAFTQMIVFLFHALQRAKNDQNLSV